MKQDDLKQRLQVAFQTLNLSQLSEQDSAINNEPSVITRKRPSGDGHPAAQKQMVEWPLVLPSNEPTSPFAIVSACLH